MGLNYKKIAQRLAEDFRTFHGNDPTRRQEELLDYFRNGGRFRNRILPRLYSAFPWFCSRPATEDDFQEFCQREGVDVVFAPQIKAGICVWYEDRSFIFLNADLSGPLLRYVMFHEIGHYLFHGPSTRFINLATGNVSHRPEKEKKHLEAEIVAALCNSHGATDLLLTA